MYYNNNNQSASSTEALDCHVRYCFSITDVLDTGTKN